jgi:hypothetical protein
MKIRCMKVHSIRVFVPLNIWCPAEFPTVGPVQMYRMSYKHKKSFIFSNQFETKTPVQFEIVDTFSLQRYLEKLSHKERSVLCNCRISAYSLSVENGRYRNLPNIETKCLSCYFREIEYQYNLVLMCPLFSEKNTFNLIIIKTFFFFFLDW